MNIRRSLTTLAVLWLTIPVAVGAITLVSVEQEIEIGRQANAQVRHEMPQLTDGQVVAYVRGIGQRLVRHAPGPKYPYSFGVVNYREVNAFALPGGPVWVQRGLIHAATNESQLAGVVAHEIAHIAQRHAASQLTNGMVANGVLGVLGAFLGNGAGAGAAQVAAGLLANGAMLRFSRDHERDADQVGLQIMRRAGWDGRGIVELFEILRREQRRDPSTVETWLSSHPSATDRISRLQADVARNRGGTRDTQQFRAVKARLLRMAPPRSMSRD